MSQLWMITYDISKHKIRHNISKELQNYGLRVQYSVFECRLNKKQLKQLRSTLQELIEESDKIRWYPLCNWCEADIQWQGNGQAVETNEYYLL